MHKKSKRKVRYREIINPIHHLERVIETLDQENDHLQQRVLLLSILSVILAVIGILLALFYNHS
jgi:hypothetical protein